MGCRRGRERMWMVIAKIFTSTYYCIEHSSKVLCIHERMNYTVAYRSGLSVGFIIPQRIQSK